MVGKVFKTVPRNIFRAEAGATMLEYALLVCLISLVALAGVARLGVGARDTFEDVGSHLGGSYFTN